MRINNNILYFEKDFNVTNNIEPLFAQAGNTGLRKASLWLMLLGMSCFLLACGSNTEERVKAENADRMLAAQHRVLQQERMMAASMVTAKRRAKSSLMHSTPPPGYMKPSNDRFLPIENQGIHLVSSEPVSTFSVDVDTAAYSIVRSYLSNGNMPPSDAVRIEELINYFDYDYPSAKDDQVFAVDTEVATAPWNDDALLLRIGLQAKQADLEARPDANLVFLLDVSGSMHGDDRLGLIKKGVRIMLKQLTANDRVSIVVYAGASGLVLDSAAGNHYAQILSALDQLSAGGSTHGSAGIRLAYKTAKQNFIKDGINRVILATDGDFNIGTVDHQSLIDMVKREAGEGVELTVLGVGRGNYNDATMEQLADQGNGNYAYLDNVKEANRVLGRHLLSNLFTVARDVKLQVEFNPSHVAEYRLIGYENRTLAREDFNNDKADAGEMGAGHNVTALYEIVLNESKGRRVDPSRYQNEQAVGSSSDELAFIKVRYKPLDNDESQLSTYPVSKLDIKSIDKASDDFKYSAAVAAFGQLLRQSKYTNEFTYDDVQALVRQSRGADVNGERGSFLGLVELAKNTDQSY